MSVQPRGARTRPRVVIIGAGFGGLEAARSLRNCDVDITLLDRRNFHLFQPLLYQVATAALSPGDIAWPTRSIFRHDKNLTVLMAEVSAIDISARTVTDGRVVIPFDFLILATGAAHSYFGHDEWSAFAPALKTIDDALSIRERLLRALEQAELSTDAVERQRLMTTVIVGGGATGVEMAGAIAELDHRTLSGEFRNIDPVSARILLDRGGAANPAVLSGTLGRGCSRLAAIDARRGSNRYFRDRLQCQGCDAGRRRTNRCRHDHLGSGCGRLAGDGLDRGDAR